MDNGHITVRPHRSETAGKIAEALAKAQKALKHPTKNSDNPFFKSTYADINEVFEAGRVLADFGLALTQIPTTDEMGNTELITELVHVSGEWYRSYWPIRPQKPDPQTLAAHVTYARRICYQAICGIAPQDGSDDDGNAASGRDVAARQPFPPKGNGNVHPALRAALPVAPTEHPEENDGSRVFDVLDRDGAPVSKRYHRKQLRYIHSADPTLLERLLNSPRYRDAIPPDMQQSIRGYRKRLDREEQLLKAAQEAPEVDGPTSDMHFELEE